MTQSEVEANIMALSARVQRLEDGESEALGKLEEMIYAMADSLGLEVGFGPYAVKKDVAAELIRKGVGRIGYGREEGGACD